MRWRRRAGNICATRRLAARRWIWRCWRSACAAPDLLDPQTWAPLADFVEVGEGQLRFRHDLVRMTAYEGLGYRRRRELHGALADALRARTDDVDPVVPLLALHYSEGHRWADAWEWSRAAATGAIARSAAGDAFVLLGRALDAAARLPDAPGPEIAELAELRADLALRLGQTDEAHRALRLSRARRDGDVVGTVRCLRKHGDVAEREGRYGPAMRWHRRALRAAEADASVPVRREALQARLSYAVALYFQGRLRETIAWCAPVCDEARALEDDAALAQACMQIEVAAAELSPPEHPGLANVAEDIFRAARRRCLARQPAPEPRDRGVQVVGLDRRVRALRGSRARVRPRRRRSGRCAGPQQPRRAPHRPGTRRWRRGRTSSTRCRVFQASRYRYGTGLTEGGLARLDLRAGNPAEAAARLDAASEIFTALGATALVVDTLVRRVEWHLMDDDPIAALVAIDTAERAAATTDPIAILPATIARLRAESTTWRDGPELGLALARTCGGGGARGAVGLRGAPESRRRGTDPDEARPRRAGGRGGTGPARRRARRAANPTVRWNQA